MALCHPKMQPYTKVGIPTSNNMRFAQAVIHLQLYGLAVSHINESNWKTIFNDKSAIQLHPGTR